jgi:glycosyltransferase involved in cell wall biosynthesis
MDGILEELGGHHQVSVFERRKMRTGILSGSINNTLVRRDLQAFLRGNDVVFFEWASGMLGHATHMPRHCRIVVRMHRYEMYDWVDRIDWNHVDGIILVSEAKQREFASRFPAQAGKVTVIREAVDTDRFRPAAKTFGGDIGILCHLSPRKRVYELILTFYDLLKQRDDLHLHIGGGPDAGFQDYDEALHGLVRKLNLGDKVTFYGNVKDPAGWYHKIDVFISNAYSEGIQVAALESMSSGCLCLAHHWDGAEEMLPEACLYYTDSELQQKILAYSAAPANARQAQQEQMRRIVCERFNIQHAAVRIREFIECAGARTDNEAVKKPAFADDAPHIGQKAGL